MELRQAKITKELVEELSYLKFTDRDVDISRYDWISIDYNTLTLYREQIEEKRVLTHKANKKNGLMCDEYEVNCYDRSVTRQFKQNNMSGAYIEF